MKQASPGGGLISLTQLSAPSEAAGDRFLEQCRANSKASMVPNINIEDLSHLGDLRDIGDLGDPTDLEVLADLGVQADLEEPGHCYNWAQVTNNT